MEGNCQLTLESAQTIESTGGTVNTRYAYFDAFEAGGGSAGAAELSLEARLANMETGTVAVTRTRFRLRSTSC